MNYIATASILILSTLSGCESAPTRYHHGSYMPESLYHGGYYYNPYRYPYQARALYYDPILFPSYWSWGHPYHHAYQHRYSWR